MSKQYALGAVVHAGGVHFKVWAPFAERVAVAGDFNDWSHTATPMAKNDDGTWSANVPNAEVGQSYRYVIMYDGKELLRSDPRALQLNGAENSALIVDTQFDWGNDTFQLASPEKLLIYELHVGSFARSDPATIARFEEVVGRLDYLAELGVNAIELMPIHAVSDGVGWGYSPVNIYAVEAAYGGRHAFMAFVKAAHEKGIGIILDVVYNHMSEHGLDMWQFDGWSKDNMGGIYFYNDQRAETPWGNTRFDYGRPEVRQFILDNARMLAEDYHIDGLRVDATLYMRKSAHGDIYDEAPDIPEGWQVLQDINKTVKRVRPRSILIAEDLQGNEWVTKPLQENGAGFDAQWDPSFNACIREVMEPTKDEERDLEKIRYILNNRFNGSPWQRVIFTESHDADANGGARLDEEIAPGHATSLYARKRSTLAAGLLFTAPGIPMLFQGQEFLENGSFVHWRPLDWGKTKEFAGILELYKHLIKLRFDAYGHTRGLMGANINVFSVDTTKKVVAYHRWDKGGPKDDVVVVANLADKVQHSMPINFPSEGHWRVRFNSDWHGYSKDFSNVGSYDTRAEATTSGFIGKVTVGPYALLILSKDN